METLTIDSIKSNGWLILEAITGSKAYGLDNEKSDTDIRGVFVLPKHLCQRNRKKVGLLGLNRPGNVHKN